MSSIAAELIAGQDSNVEPVSNNLDTKGKVSICSYWHLRHVIDLMVGAGRWPADIAEQTGITDLVDSYWWWRANPFLGIRREGKQWTIFTTMVGLGYQPPTEDLAVEANLLRGSLSPAADADELEKKGRAQFHHIQQLQAWLENARLTGQLFDTRQEAIEAILLAEKLYGPVG